MDHRRHFLSLALLLGLPLITPAKSAPAEEPAFEFDHRPFFLRSDEGGILEYLPAGETFEKWRTLMSVREFAGTSNPKAYAQKLLANAKASGPNAQGQLMKNEAANSYIVDFIVHSKVGTEPPFAEWNLWRVEKNGAGVEAVQYARRFYKVTDSTAQEIIDAREKIVPELAVFAKPKGKNPEPNAEADAAGFDPARLAGVHPVSGRNPDGTAYKGTVEIRVVNGLVGLEWKIGDGVTHGNGVLVGMTLGVALDDGIAIYQLFGQSEGQSLIGRWSGAGAKTASEEAILIGNADMTTADIPAGKLNGAYFARAGAGSGKITGKVTVSGGDVAKKVQWKTGDQTSKCQGLALGEGLAILTPAGLSVFERSADNATLVGSTVTGEGAISAQSLDPAE